MSKNEKATLLPRLRFPGFQTEWTKESLSTYLKESRVKGSTGNIAKKLTVKLWGKGVFEKQEAILGSENTQYFHRKKGQFIYSKLDFLNQAFGIVPEYLDGYESTVDLPCFDISPKLNSKFLLEYVQRPAFYKYHGEIADGGRKAKRIQVETFLGFSIAISELPEQQKIADCLSSLDDLITAEDKKLSALKDHKKGIMQKLFPAEGETVPEWRFPEFRGSGEWEKCSLKDVFSILLGYAFSSKDSVSDGARWLKIADVSIQTMNHNNPSYLPIEYKKLFETFTVRQGDYVIALTRPILNGVLKMSMVDSVFDGALLNQRVGKLVTVQNSSFVYFLLQTSSVISIIEKSILGSEPPNLSTKQIEDVNSYIPSNIEQQKIADCLATVDDLITAQAEKIEALKAHKKGLMQGLFPSIEEVEHE